MKKNISKTVALFDFDGTITYCDTSALSLLHAAPWKNIFLQGIPCFFLLVRATVDSKRASIYKESICQKLLRGMDVNAYENKVIGFNKRIMPKLIRKKALERIQWHKKQGHLVIIVTRTPIQFLSPWIRQQQIIVLGTTLKVTKGVIQGSFVEGNCEGKHKVDAVKSLLGDLKKYTFYAYGDSENDRPMLNIAEYQFFKPFRD